jgi:hypothetical protein
MSDPAWMVKPGLIRRALRLLILLEGDQPSIALENRRQLEGYLYRLAFEGLAQDFFGSRDSGSWQIGVKTGDEVPVGRQGHTDLSQTEEFRRR